MKLYYCKHCKNLFAAIDSSGISPLCCGEEMTLLKPQTKEAGSEKHVPDIRQEGNRVLVTVYHPMEENHHIEWIALKTNKGFSVRYLQNSPAKTCFDLTDGEELISAYAYCNVHGLWMAGARK